MGRHKDSGSLEFIDWLKAKGEELGYFTELEYPMVPNEYFIDVVWKLKKEHSPLMTFEVETKDNRSIFANTLKIYGTPSSKVPKPWRHFMIIFRGELSKGHRDNLAAFIMLHNFFLFENVCNEENKKKLEEKLQSLNISHNLSGQIKKELTTRSLGDALEEVVKGLTDGLNDGVIGNTEVGLSFKSTETNNNGLPFSIITETTKGEPTLYEKMTEASKTLKPFTIKSPQLKKCTINGKPLFPEGRKKVSITITPQAQSAPPVRLKVLGSNVLFDNVMLWRIRTDGNIDHLSSQKRNLPFIFNFMIDRTGKNDRFNFEFDSNTGDVIQALQFEELLLAINQHKTIALVNPEDNQPIMIFGVNQTFEQSEDWRYLLSKLAYIQKETGHGIPAPTKITKENIKDILTIIQAIKTGQNSGLLNEITVRINKKAAKDLVEHQKRAQKISNMTLVQDTSIELFNEKIPFGKSTINLPDMQFVLPIEEVEKILDAQSGEGNLLSLAMKPLADRNVTMKFDNWPKKN